MCPDTSYAIIHHRINSRSRLRIIITCNTERIARRESHCDVLSSVKKTPFCGIISGNLEAQSNHSVIVSRYSIDYPGFRIDIGLTTYVGR